jgi:ABC-type transport system involved in multi-copper enzyme maturation permease subunit
MILGPVFRAELIRTARRKRYYVLRVLYGLVLLLLLSQRYSQIFEYELLQQRRIMLAAMAAFGLRSFIAFTIVQIAAILVLVPPLVAGVIADEKQRNTLHYLMASRLSSGEIVCDKLLARLLHLAAFVAIGLPVICMLSFFGGVPPEYVVAAYSLTAATTWLTAALAILVSTLARRVRQAVLIAYLIEVAWLIGPLLVSLLMVYLDHLLGTRLGPSWNPFFILVMGASPIGLLLLLQEPELQRIVGPLSPATFATLIGIYTALGLGFLLLAIIRLRPTYHRQQAKPRRLDWFGPKVRRPRFLNRPPCGADAMLWKERWFGRTDVVTKLFVLPATILLTVGLVLFSGLDETAGQALRSLWVHGWHATVYGQPAFHDALRRVSVYYIALWGLAVAGSASSCVSSEREGDTWMSLISTPLSGREILMGKLLGAIWNQRGFAGMLGLLWLVGLVTGALHPLGLLTGIAVLGLFTWFVAALGTYYSLRMRTTSQALTATIATLLLLNVGYLFPLLPLLEDYPTLMVGVTPLVASYSLFSALDMRNFLDRILVAPHPLQFKEARFVAMALGCLAFYALAALLLTFRTIGRFDRLVGRPVAAKRRREVETSRVSEAQPVLST